ncbi:MAG TPA: hypothetical protein VHR45_04155 [Thermoanaerobaculia bacterium]|nr:hypothetical protein [Thermoanaerobaculia bacterium]
MATPEYLVCLECESPCYVFEWSDGKIGEILCLACGNEDPEQFADPDELEAEAMPHPTLPPKKRG